MNDLVTPSLAELHTAEAICQLKTHQGFVEPMNSTFYGPKRNSWAVEKSHGHHTLQQQIRQPTPIPVLRQSTNFLNPLTDNYGTFSFYRNSSQAFPWSAEAFEKYFPRAGLQTHTQPIERTYEAQNQYGQPQDGRPQYGQAQHVEHSQQTVFPRTLGPSNLSETAFRKMLPLQLNSILSTPETSRKRMAHASAKVPTSRRDKYQHQASPPQRSLHHPQPSAQQPSSTHIRQFTQPPRYPSLQQDPWLWFVSDVYFSLTNILSYDLLHPPSQQIRHRRPKSPHQSHPTFLTIPRHHARRPSRRYYFSPRQN